MEDRDVKHIRMTLDEWAAVKDAPIQRDTRTHFNNASRRGGHLSKAHETHRHVAMAAVYDKTGNMKQTWKLDGHSRSYGWQEGLLTPPPQKLIVTVYPVKNKLEACEFFSTFDNSAATEVKRDKLFGALRFYGVIPKHGILWNNCGLMSAIEYLVFPPKYADLRNISFMQMLEPWVETIELIDKSVEFTDHTRFRSSAMLAMIMTTRSELKKGKVQVATAIEFWQGYHDDVGSKSAKSCDGIFGATALMDLMSFESEKKWGRRMHGMYGPYFLHCYDQWHAGRRMQKIDRVASRTRLMKDVLTIREWWQKNLGELDQPQIRADHPEDHSQQMLQL